MAKSGIKVFIEVVVEDTWICDLRNPETFYSNVTALALLNHLCAHLGGLHAVDMVTLTLQMSKYYKGVPDVPEYIQMVKDAQRKAAQIGLPVTDQTLLILASAALLAAYTFPRTTYDWEERNPADKTWTTWKTAYLGAHKGWVNCLRATGRANNLGHANANQATSFLDSIDNTLDILASAATNNKAVLKKLVATNASLTTSNTNLANQIKTLQTQLNTKKGRGGNDGGGSGGGGGSGSGGGSNDTGRYKGPDPAGYCWSRGWCIRYGHNSTTCANQKEGHQCNATCQNSKGGSSANKDWTPRRA